MQRTIASFERDEAGDYVAVLDCGHRQHVRHKPPFIERPWVILDADRTTMIGSQLDCKACDSQEPIR